MYSNSELAVRQQQQQVMLTSEVVDTILGDVVRVYH
jgi:hypothetical protein